MSIDMLYKTVKGEEKTMEKENQTVEWKETWKDEYLKWICGFANANGGGRFTLVSTIQEK